jgi:enoyl-CoA hydratase/carnithine racemase
MTLETPKITVKSRIDGHARIVSIERLEDDNRIDMNTMDQLSAAIDEAEGDAKCKVLVLTGSGEWFCAGGRIGGFPVGTTQDQLEYARAFTILQERMARCQKPIVAAINGHCTAGGMSVIESCDIAIAVDHAEFGYPEINNGLFPMLAIAVARRNLAPKLAFDLFYSGRRMKAAEAHEARLVNEVVSPGALWTAVAKWVDLLSGRSASSMMIGRQAFYAMGNMGPTAALEYAHVALIAMLNGAHDEKKSAA